MTAMDSTPRVKSILAGGTAGSDISVQGWIRTRRDSKDLCFVEVNDGSCQANLQVVASKAELEGYDEIVPRLTTGASVEAAGRLVASPGKGQAVELQASRIRIVGDAPAADYPLQKKRHSFEFLREIAHLRPRTNTFGAVARVRNALSFAIHEFFQERGFSTSTRPIITGSDCEGAGAMFQVTTLPLEAAADRGTARSTTRRTSSASGPPHGERPARGARSTPRPSATSTPSAPPSAPRTRTRRATSPSSG